MFNVQDYGAVGDGIVDDTGPVLAATEDAHSTNSGVLYFPAGRYNLTAEWVVNPRRVSIVGDGPQATQIQPAGTLTLGWDGTFESGVKPEPYDAVRGLSFVGAEGTCVRLSNAPNVQANSLTFRDVGFHGFDVQVDLTHRTYLVGFDRCFFTQPQTHAVRMDNPTGSGENISFRSCVFSGGPATMVYVNMSGASFNFSACSFDYCARALWLRAGSVSMSQCHFETGNTWGGEFLLVDRRGYVSRPMLTLTDCDFFAFPTSYDTVVRLRGDHGDQALRVTNPNMGVSSPMCHYLVRDDGPYRSSIRLQGAWCSRGDYPPPKLRAQSGAEWPIGTGVYTEQGPDGG